MSELKPVKIPVGDVPVETETPTFRVARMVEGSRSGSDLVLGLAWMDSGGEAVSWTADAKTHEAYYIVRGHLRVTWDGVDAGAEDLGPQDAFFFPPARTYTIESIGAEQVFLVWSLSSAP